MQNRVNENVLMEIQITELQESKNEYIAREYGLSIVGIVFLCLIMFIAILFEDNFFLIYMIFAILFLYTGYYSFQKARELEEDLDRLMRF
jgi:predicted membrane protein